MYSSRTSAASLLQVWPSLLLLLLLLLLLILLLIAFVLLVGEVEEE